MQKRRGTKMRWRTARRPRIVRGACTLPRAGGLSGLSAFGLSAFSGSRGRTIIELTTNLKTGAQTVLIRRERGAGETHAECVRKQAAAAKAMIGRGALRADAEIVFAETAPAAPTAAPSAPQPASPTAPAKVGVKGLSGFSGRGLSGRGLSGVGLFGVPPLMTLLLIGVGLYLFAQTEVGRKILTPVLKRIVPFPVVPNY